MKTFLVGGAVRDLLLGLELKDRDFVVVGSTPEEMLVLGFTQVGSNFPVFLHPITKEAFALARKERKVGGGYHGFEFDAGRNVSLEEDLIRRDITINAMAIPVALGAKDTECNFSKQDIIDPFGGQEDLANGILRHVSGAFVQDPVRALRLARFAARFDFVTAKDTKRLVKTMLLNGELNYLTPERVWIECEKGLGESKADLFFTTLKELGVLKTILPEIDALFGIPAVKKWHPEVDTGVHVMLALRYACQITADLETRFAVLLHDLGKGVTPKEEWPYHTGHETTGIPLVKGLCQRLKVPGKFKDLAVKFCEYHLHAHRVEELRPKTVLKVLNGLDVFRKKALLPQFLDAAESDFFGRGGLGNLGSGNKNYYQREVWERIFASLINISSSSYIKQGMSGEKIAKALHVMRLKVIRQEQGSRV